MAKFILHRKTTHNYHNVQLTTAIISFRARFSLGGLSAANTAFKNTGEKGAERRRGDERRMGQRWWRWWWWFWEEEGDGGGGGGGGLVVAAVVGVHVNTADNFAEESYSNGACWSTSNESPPMAGWSRACSVWTAGSALNGKSGN